MAGNPRGAGTYASDAGSFDPNLDQLVYEWTDSEGRIIGDWAVFSWGSALPPGTYPFKLTLRDGHGGTASDTMTVTISPTKDSVAHLAWSSPAGAWRQVDDPTAAQALALWHPNAGAPKINTALANPVNYVDVSILADPTQTYKLWVRLRAENNYWGNDSIFVQFEGGAMTQDGQTRVATGTTDALDINLEQCSGCGVSGWGWRDERWGGGLAATPVLLRFPRGGWQRVRIQTREDGVIVDQMVLSSGRYLNQPPGPRMTRRFWSSTPPENTWLFGPGGPEGAAPAYPLAPCFRNVAWTSGFPSAMAMSAPGSPFRGALMSAPAAMRRSTTAE